MATIPIVTIIIIIIITTINWCLCVCVSAFLFDSHKNATVRAEAAKLLAAIVTKMGPAKTLSGAKDVTERILPAAAHFLQDGSLEAR